MRNWDASMVLLAEVAGSSASMGEVCGVRDHQRPIENLHEGMGLAITTERLWIAGDDGYICPQVNSRGDLAEANNMLGKGASEAV